MGHEHVATVFDHSRQAGSNLVILLAVASHADHQGEWVADQPTLQQRARLSRRHLQKVLGDLVHAGELAITSHHGRGRRSTYRLLVGPTNASPTAPIPQKRAPASAFPVEKPAARSAYPSQEPATRSAFSEAQSVPGSAFYAPPVPPCPPFPPDPQYPLNPPSPPEKLRQETFGLAPAPTNRQAPSQRARKAKPATPELPFPPLPFGVGAGGTHGRGAGGEGPRAVPAVLVPPLPGKGGGSWERGGGEGLRPLSQPQSAVFRANLLLEEAAIPLSSPAQIGLWAKTLGGIEPLLDLLRRLIHAGLATKREPIAYIHRVVLERAARPEPAAPIVPAWYGGHSRRPHNPTLAAGVDDIRREQAARIAGITLPRSGA